MEQTWTAERLRHLIQTRLRGRKFIVVSNREPFVHQKKEDGSIECTRPASGMATALHPIMMASGGTWVAHGSGSGDREVVDEHSRIPVPPGEPGYTLRRVWIEPNVFKRFYNGLANEGLWPLCHITFTRPQFRPGDWEGYKEANRIFAEAVLEEAAGEKAFVFIQGLPLLPAAGHAEAEEQGPHHLRPLLAHPVAEPRGLPHLPMGRGTAARHAGQ